MPTSQTQTASHLVSIRIVPMVTRPQQAKQESGNWDPPLDLLDKLLIKKKLVADFFCKKATSDTGVTFTSFGKKNYITSLLNLS